MDNCFQHIQPLYPYWATLNLSGIYRYFLRKCSDKMHFIFPSVEKFRARIHHTINKTESSFSLYIRKKFHSKLNSKIQKQPFIVNEKSWLVTEYSPLTTMLTSSRLETNFINISLQSATFTSSYYHHKTNLFSNPQLNESWVLYMGNNSVKIIIILIISKSNLTFFLYGGIQWYAFKRFSYQ